MSRTSIRAAAVQIEAEVGAIEVNLEKCRRQADAAAMAGAEWIVLPEFFSTGVAFLAGLSEEAPAPDGAPTQLLLEVADRHGAIVGGSTLVRDPDGEVRNAFLLAGPGGILGRHDKDIPTMWENALYVGGSDPGRMNAGGVRVGAALCWELMRTQTVERLRGQVDVVLSGSGWWSIPTWPPRALTSRLERRNAARATGAAAEFARYVGAPVIHAAHAGPVSCPWPLAPFGYRGHFEGGASISDAEGRTLAHRSREEGEGFAIADVELAPGAGVAPPGRFWLQERGAIAAASWAYQNPHGRRFYRRLQRARVEHRG